MCNSERTSSYCVTKQSSPEHHLSSCHLIQTMLFCLLSNQPLLQLLGHTSVTLHLFVNRASWKFRFMYFSALANFLPWWFFKKEQEISIFLLLPSFLRSISDAFQHIVDASCLKNLPTCCRGIFHLGMLQFSFILGFKGFEFVLSWRNIGPLAVCNKFLNCAVGLCQYFCNWSISSLRQ